MSKNNSANQTELDFEITFCEKLIAEKSDFIEPLILLGDLYSKKGLYKKALQIDKRLSKLKPDDPAVHYNLACSYSLLGMENLALKTLEKAIDLGYTDFVYMEKDTDLDSLKKDPRYRKLVSKYIKNRKYQNSKTF